MPRKPAKHPAKPKRGKKLEIEEPGVLYGRYSSHNQKDISVEQQFEKGYELAAEYGIRIIDTYADRAVSGRTDKRRDFQRMMTDAAKGKFRYVIAWKSNRMGRNMLEALINEARLQDLGVRVLYVEEDFDDTAAGRFAARSMMNVNQFYSENMAEDIKRGLYDNAANCMVANGHLPYGYKADETLHYAIDEPKAAVIREIFTRVSCGEAFVDIMASLNARGIKTSYGRPWGRSSFQKILSNERYRGIYIYGDVRKEGGIPRIISDELYFKVQEVITTKKNPQGRHRVNGDYLLTGKLFCGHCKSPMTGVSGTGRSGNLHYYYVCQKRRTEKTCDKKNVRRDEIELQVAQAIKDYALKDDVIEWIADSTVAYNERKEAESKVGILEDQLAGTEHGIKNIMSAIEQGIITETTKSRLVELESERATIKANIAAARADIVTVSRDDIISGLEMFRDGDVHDKKYQARLFDTFLVAVYAYDDDLRLVFSFSGNKNTIQIPIESAVNAVENNEAECSFKLCSAPPRSTAVHYTMGCRTFYFSVEEVLISSSFPSMRVQKSSMLGFCFFTDGLRGKTHKILDICAFKGALELPQYMSSAASRRIEKLRFGQSNIQSRAGDNAECALNAVHRHAAYRRCTVAEDERLIREVAEHHEGLAYHARDDRTGERGPDYPAVEQEPGQQSHDEFYHERARNVQAVGRYKVGKSRAESGRRRAPPRPEQERRKQNDSVTCVDVAADGCGYADDHRRNAAERRKQRRKHQFFDRFVFHSSSPFFNSASAFFLYIYCTCPAAQGIFRGVLILYRYVYCVNPTGGCGGNRSERNGQDKFPTRGRQSFCTESAQFLRTATPQSTASTAPLTQGRFFRCALRIFKYANYRCPVRNKGINHSISHPLIQRKICIVLAGSGSFPVLPALSIPG